MWSDSSKSVSSKQHGRLSNQAIASKFSANDPLSLPSIDRDVSKNVSIGPTSTDLLLLAKSMLNAGLIKDAAYDGSIGDLVANGLNEWIGSIWGNNRLLSLEARLHEHGFITDTFDDLSESDLNGAVEGCVNDLGLDFRQRHLTLVIGSKEERLMMIGDGVDSLEAKFSGLGYEVAKTIEVGCRGYGVVGHSWHENAVENTYWGGESSEKEYTEIYGESIEDFNGMTNDEFNHIVPKVWSKSNGLTDKNLAVACKSKDKNVREIAKKIARIRMIGEAGHGFGFGSISGLADWYENVELTVILGWKDKQGVIRFVDDYRNDLFNNGCDIEPGIGGVLIPVDDPDWFERKRKEWLPKAEFLRLMDELLCTIVDEVD